MRIIKITESPLLTKRFRVFLDTGNHYDFGLDGGHTYIDHKNQLLRQNYWIRHLGNSREHYLISSLTPSPSLFSLYLLWGCSTSLRENINRLNKLFVDKA